MSECNCDCHEATAPITEDSHLRVTAVSLASNVVGNSGQMVNKDMFLGLAKDIYDFIKGG